MNEWGWQQGIQSKQEVKFNQKKTAEGIEGIQWTLC